MLAMGDLSAKGPGANLMNCCTEYFSLKAKTKPTSTALLKVTLHVVMSSRCLRYWQPKLANTALAETCL